MPRYTQACTACDWRDDIQVPAGVHPPCPQCGGATERQWSGTAHAVIGDDIPGGMTVENGFDTPQTFYSHSAHRKALADRGLEIRAKYAGPTDQHLTNWAAGISAKHLEDARILLERGSQAKQSRLAEIAEAQAQFPITVREAALEEILT